MKRTSLALAATLATISLASAQTYMDSKGTVVPGVAPLVGCAAGGSCAGPVSATNPLPVSGSFSLGGFQPGSAYATPLSVSTTSSRVALPAGTVVVVYNTGASAAYVQLGGSSVVATTSNDVVPAGGWMAFSVGSNAYLAAITASGTASLNVSGGSGLPTGAGGGGSGGAVPTGSAGSPNANVVSVQGIAGGTAQPVTGTFWQATQPVSLASLPALTAGSNAIGSVIVSGNAGAPTQTSVSVGTSSATVLAASTATSFLKLCVALGAANGVWVRWDGGVATQAAPAEYIPPGQCDSWVKSTGFLPTSQINAIASASVSVSLIYN